jgi:hypothetical protein
MWILQSPEGTFRLTSGAVKTVGRAPRADFILDVALVSRLHCRLTAGDEKARLATGDRLRIGRVELTVGRQPMANG